MKASQIPQRVYIPEPFANGGLLKPVQETASSLNDVTFHDGFPSAYSAPSQNGGKFVERGQINAIGNLATVNEYFRACGGINTFDQRLANKIGGYYKGAVLEIIEGLRYSKVISLVDDNMVDFTGNPIDSNIVNNQCVSGSVDGVNWAYCDGQYISGNINILDIPNFQWDEDLASVYSEEIFPIGNFICPRDGVFSFSGEMNIDIIPVQSGGVNTWGGFLVLIKKDATQGPREVEYDVIYSKGLVESTSYQGIQYNTYETTVINAEKDARYSVWIFNQGSTVTNSTLKLQIV